MSTNSDHEDATSDKTNKVAGRKRIRRNAIKPNSIESDLLREFSVQQQLDQIQISIVTEAEEKGEECEDEEENRKKILRLDSASNVEKVPENEKEDGKNVVECDCPPVYSL